MVLIPRKKEQTNKQTNSGLLKLRRQAYSTLKSVNFVDENKKKNVACKRKFPEHEYFKSIVYTVFEFKRFTFKTYNYYHAYWSIQAYFVGITLCSYSLTQQSYYYVLY